jgi:hypothetical protein
VGRKCVKVEKYRHRVRVEKYSLLLPGDLIQTEIEADIPWIIVGKVIDSDNRGGIEYVLVKTGWTVPQWLRERRCRLLLRRVTWELE